METIRDHWRTEGEARAPLPLRRGHAEAREFYELAGASGLAAGLSIALAFWSMVFAILRIWIH